MSRKLLKYLLIGIVATLIATFLLPKEEDATANTPRDYEAILQSGVLRATTEYNAISYYVDGDTVSGLHYELLQAFAKAHGLQVELTPEMSFEKRMQGLCNGEFDLIAHGIQNTIELKDTLLLSAPILRNRQVLVQREPTSLNDSNYIKSHLELAGKTLHVVKGSPSILRIHNLSNEIADTIYIKEVANYGPEQLLSLVAHGDIDYAVCDESVARAMIDSLPQIDIHTAISFSQFYSWGVNKQSPALLDSLNQWLRSYKQTKEYKQLIKKYHHASLY